MGKGKEKDIRGGVEEEEETGESKGKQTIKAHSERGEGRYPMIRSGTLKSVNTPLYLRVPVIVCFISSVLSRR